jgi:hypothetical protein
VTVGGSHQPILASLEQHRPERVWFLCSDDSGKVKGSYVQVAGEGKVLRSDFKLDKPDLPCITALAGLARERYEVRTIKEFDDLNACYLAAAEVIDAARRERPGAPLVADYTGGTKSMTAGLAAAALDDGQVEISLVVGRRPDLVKVQDRTEFVRPIPVWDAQMARRLRAARELLQRHDYAGACDLLRTAAARFAGEKTLERVGRAIALCRGFDAWDRFDHAGARQCLEGHKADFVPLWRVLDWLTTDRGHGFERVEDLLRNAERRAVQGRYDDAVGRLYRALEMAAQTWLRERHGIDTSDVDPGRAPEGTRPRLERGRSEEDGRPGPIRIGLWDAWELITAWPDDPLGRLFGPKRNEVRTFLNVRNQSLFAHGERPVSQGDYALHAPGLLAWLDGCIEVAVADLGRRRPVRLPQLPTDFLDLDG